VRFPFIRRCRVPAQIEAVTTINRAAEVPPRRVGVTPAAVHAVWEAVQQLYRSGIHPAIQLCVRRHGEVLIDRAIGYASGNGPDDPPEARKVPLRLDTPFNIFSASKAVTAMVIHLLDERDRLRLDDRVCDYIPEFGAHAKDEVTIRHVLTHRAGIPNIPAEAMDLDLLEKPDAIMRILCAARPSSRPGRQLAYHAMSGGFVLGEVVRRVTGKDIRAVLRKEILDPLGFRWMSYGVASKDVSQVAMSYLTGPPPLPPLSTILQRALGLSMEDAARLSNDRRALTSIIPAGNVVTTANELSRFYQLLLNGGTLDGVRLFDERTIRRATSEQSYLEIDLTLGIPFRYGLGFMLGGRWLSLYGPDTEHAFGHLGFTNIIAWADPKRQVAAALTTSGKPLLYPEIYQVWNVLRLIGVACPKVGPDWQARAGRGRSKAPVARKRAPLSRTVRDHAQRR
jgi:CubicO group peptidase (beta-lactamase class C family)